MNPRLWFTSKTIWFNLLTGLVFAATFLFGYQPNDVVTHNIQAIVENPMFIVMVNLVLRFFTHKPVTLTLPTDGGTIDSAPNE